MKGGNKKSVTVRVGFLVLVLALATAATAACGSDGGSANGGGLALTQADNGQTFNVAVGDTITVAVPGNPTTGYQWEADLSEASAALLTANGEPAYDPDSTDESLVGSGGTYTFTFTAAAPGQAELKLKYWRSFEPDVAPIETFAATIDIK